MLLGAISAASAQTPPVGFETKAAQALMIEASTGTVLLSKAADKPFPPASLAKLMTVELVLDALTRGEITLDTEYAVSEYAWRTGGAPSRTSTMFAALKSRIRVDDLLKGVMVQMANDGCIILAEGMAGSEAAFTERMNERAKVLGLTGSHFANSTGLPHPDARTTLKDLVKLARHIEATYPTLYQYYRIPEFEWNKIFQRNRNPLLSFDLGIDGLASGYSEEGGFGIVASGLKDGTRLFVALSGIATDKERTEETARVLGWGQTAFESLKLFDAGEVIGAASIYGGATGSVDLVAKAPVSVFVPIGNPERLSARIVYQWPLRAPVESGSQVGTLRIFSGESLLREVPLATASSVEVGTLRQRATDALLELMFFWL
ncbi:D-alanyl-D-alanine carboxypeptidase family protein [Rhizobium sp. RU36D]|uniref:D-alanyl-D-alanine carboxypeptidase family protein n=1 Tax=Rhizobium sp. RU36D TaxID=1907415 RepID=UPI001FCE06A5|nr:D-alanyl-D-alanine carboxypeptidase family protein [Rhizobium sp. RU36D]